MLEQSHTRQRLGQHARIERGLHLLLFVADNGCIQAGTLWFAYPRPNTRVGQGTFANYGIKFDLNENSDVEVLQRDFRGVTIGGTDRPWIYTNGVKGLTECRLPLIEKNKDPGVYDVQIGFVAGANQKEGEQVFSIQLQDQEVLKDFDAAAEAGQPNEVVMKEFTRVPPGVVRLCVGLPVQRPRCRLRRSRFSAVSFLLSHRSNHTGRYGDRH